MPDDAEKKCLAACRLPVRGVRRQARLGRGAHLERHQTRGLGIESHIEFVDTARQVISYSVALKVKGTEVGSPGDNAAGLALECGHRSRR